ncbi:MAG TPA: PDZ domain-containing protein, partial [Longimicrobiales bacterium]
AQGTRILREPTVSQTHIAFVHANDLWVVERDGGVARRLTSAEGGETSPHFSPDGRWVAFTGQYAGNTDVYVVPTDGGAPTRLTWHPGADNVQGWTPDGSAVVFASGRLGHPTAIQRFFTVPVTGGLPEPLAIPRGTSGEISPDGRWIAYQEVALWDPEWRNYRGGQAQPISVVDMSTYERTAPEWTGERHLGPTWLGGEVFFLSERDWASNVWSFDPATGETRQRTFHADFDVKSLDGGGGVIAYEQGGYVHLLDPASNETRQVEIEVRGDLNWARPRWEDVPAGQLTNASLSPTGKRALFEYRGEILTVPAEEGSWRNITRSPGAADRYPVWSPDGTHVAWFNDAGGEYGLMVGDQAGLEEPRRIELPEPSFFFLPRWSPDGTRIAFTDTHYRLLYVDVATGELTHVATERYAHPNRTMQPVWSPDGRYIAYARLMDNQLKAVFIHDTRTGDTHQVTDRMVDVLSPVWEAEGKYLYFLASTDFALNTGWLDMTSYDRPVTRSLYLAILEGDEPSPLLPRSDEEAVDDEEEDEEEAAGEGRGGGAGGASEALPTVTIDFDGLENRFVRIPVPARNYTALLPAPEGYVFYLEAADGPGGQTLHRYNLEDREDDDFLSGVAAASVSHDRSKLLYRNGSNWSIVDTGRGPPEGSAGRLALNGLRVRIDPPAEWAQILREGWRYQRDFLYVGNTHGAPWAEIWDWYSPWVEHVRHRSDLNYLVDIVGGEISVGHSYTSGGDFPSLDNVGTGLLGADWARDGDRYRLARIYTGESWTGVSGPLAEPGIDVREGDYVLAVDGVELTAPTNPFQLFEATSGRQVHLLVNDRPTRDGAREVTVVPTGNEGQLRSWAWIEGNRRRVDEMSGGRLAYVYLPNTGQGGYTYFNRMYFAQQDKQGAVIDERNNGGGSAADYIVDVLARRLTGYFNSRADDHRPFTQPMAGLYGPKVMIINERSGSGGDLMPYLFRFHEVGPLVGTRTWGGLVGTWDTPLFIDGGRMVAPRGGFFDVNGEWAVEAEGVAPDIEVINDPVDLIAGRDAQLEAAVREALRLLETRAVPLAEEPPSPVRWRRPGRTGGGGG